MSHDFLTSLHSSVIDVYGRAQRKVAEEKSTASVAIAQKAAKEGMIDDLHRTIGVSMSPKLRERAVQRASAIGVSFSRYVQWCLEAELEGSSLAERFKSNK